MTGVSADATYIAEPGYGSAAAVIIEEPAEARVVFAEPPPLVVVEPDVYVVEDASYAIYFVDGFYWHVGGAGHWYRARRWDEPWVRVEAHFVPPRISHRDHHAYVHFRASASARVFRQPRERGSSDRSLRAEERRPERTRQTDRRRDERREPSAKPKREVRRSNENAARPDRSLRGAPAVDRDRVERGRLDRDKVDPRRPERERKVDPVQPSPRSIPEPRPRVEPRRPDGVEDHGRPSETQKKRPVDNKKKAVPKKPGEKGRPRDAPRR
ncbi:MAG: hypothetical protein JNK04_09980 [Myxococcales bacterium]|nr:hypothetical protein [Myxococcales bacterium]